MEEHITLAVIIINALKTKGLTVEKLSHLTGISERFLISLIEEQPHHLPAYPYVRGYLMKIAEVLDLDHEVLWQAYLFHIGPVLKKSGATDRLPVNRFAPSARNKKLFIATGFLIVIGGYFGYTTYHLTAPPRLLLDTVYDAMVVSAASLPISGIVDIAYQLTINGSPVYPESDGRFSHEIILVPGFNTITFALKTFLGKIHTITRTVFYEMATSTVLRDPVFESPFLTPSLPLTP